MYGRWDYAIAAYNAGEGRVRRAIRQSQKTGLKVPWTHFLPTETRRYLPKIFALRAIIKQPKRYGISLPNVYTDTYFSVTDSHRTYAFSQVAETCTIDSDTLHLLNAQWRGHTLGSESGSALLLPRDKFFACRKKLNKIPLFTNQWARHKIKKSDSTVKLAWLYNTTPSAIEAFNSLGKHSLRERGYLVIRKNTQSIPRLSTNALLEKAITARESLGPRQIQHQVKPKETIHSIGKHHQVKTAKIAYWNRLKYPYAIQSGQTLIIWKNSSQPSSSTRYIVQPGDTLSQIAKAHKVTMRKILVANQISDPSKLRPFQVITIPK